MEAEKGVIGTGSILCIEKEYSCHVPNSPHNKTQMLIFKVYVLKCWLCSEQLHLKKKNISRLENRVKTYCCH